MSSLSSPEEHSSTTPPAGSGPSESGRKRRKVTRSRAGCLTCRKRRKLCDMAKPHCGACERLRMECVWPPVRSLESETSTARHRLSETPASPSTISFPSASVSNSHGTGNSNGNNNGENVDITPRRESHSLAAPASTTTIPQLLPPPTEQSAVDGLMNLFSADTSLPNGNNYTLPPFPQQNPSPPIRYPLPTTSLSNQTLIPPTQTFEPFKSPQDSIFGSNMFSFDDATLQLWAADCLPSLSGNPTQNPFDSLNDLLFQSNPPISQSFQPPVVTPSSSSPISNTDSHTAILSHYQESLSTLVSCSTGEQAQNGFDAFTTLANATMSNQLGQGLHLSILAWAGRHMVNQGQHKYEAVSERLGSQAAQIILEKLARESELALMDERDLMTLFAGLLMLIQFKICRGDVWGFDTYVDHLLRLTPLLFPSHTPPKIDPNSTSFHFFENLIYHYTVSSSLLTRGPIMSDAVLSAYARPAIDVLHTLTGVSLQSFCIMHQIAGLIRQKRSHTNGIWTDETMSDFIGMAERMEVDLEKERVRLDTLVRAKPHLATHRYFHEAFRIACLLQLRAFVLGNAPSSLNIRFLVRRALSLLEAMADQNLPGFCSAHWVIFTTAVCAASHGQGIGELDDRARVDRLYDRTINSLAFLNTSRSRKIVHDVWAKNRDGEVLVDWLDILAEYDWEIIFA